MNALERHNQLLQDRGLDHAATMAKSQPEPSVATAPATGDSAGILVTCGLIAVVFVIALMNGYFLFPGPVLIAYLFSKAN